MLRLATGQTLNQASGLLDGITLKGYLLHYLLKARLSTFCELVGHLLHHTPAQVSPVHQTTLATFPTFANSDTGLKYILAPCAA